MAVRTTDLDHVGVGVRDLDAAARAYERLGFTLSPFARHAGAVEPGGPTVQRATGNRCAMLSAGYIELIAIIDPKLPSGDMAARIADREGIHIVAFGCDDPAATNAALKEAGFGARGTVYLERMVDTPQGPRLAKFDRVPVAASDVPEGVIFHLKHLTRDAIWQPQLLKHANGAVALDEVVIHVTDLNEAARRFERQLGVRGAGNGGTRTFTLPRGRCVLVDSTALPQADAPKAPAVVGITVTTSSIGQAEEILKGKAVSHSRRGDRLFVDPKETCGVFLTFAPA